MEEPAAVKAGRHQVSIEGLAEAWSADYAVEKVSDGLFHLRLSLRAKSPMEAQPLRLVWHHPLVNTHARWFPGCEANRTILPEWRAGRICRCKNTLNAPVYSLFTSDGTNSLTFAISDALNSTVLAAGVVEETATVKCEVTLFAEPTAPISSYDVTLRLDTRAVPYHRALRETAQWWAGHPGFAPSAVPEHARLPMYSSWYSFHQLLEPGALEAQCRIAKGLGMESVIVDDGWQTDDNSRGYAYCGDWEVTPSKFPDFAGHVARVHDIGMKYILWFSVPFVGVHTSAYRRFKDKVLDPAAQTGWHVLDVRYGEVRDYLVELYASFVERYGIDGFKLDFVDTFELSRQTRDTRGGGRDFDSVPEAVDRLLTDTMETLRALKPDVLIEFRQSYIGPLMRKYGNMFRAGDVPGDYHGNRISTLDIRLISGGTPAHSDMVMWNAGESVESAAMQLAHVLFSVPQVSVMLDELPDEHVDMIRFYLSFWRGNRDVLLDGELMPLAPDMLYPAVVARNDRKLLAACYGVGLVPIGETPPPTVIVVNGTFRDSVVLETARDAGPRQVTVKSPTGKVVREHKMRLSAGLHALKIPPAGVAILESC